MEKMWKIPLLILLWTVVVCIIGFALAFLYGVVLAFQVGPELLAGAP